LGQVVDTETAKEFMAETLAKVDLDQLAAICADLEAKARSFQERLGPEALPVLPHDELPALLARIFATRGATRSVLTAIEWPRLRAWIEELLRGAAPVHERLPAFVARIEGIAENLRIDFASELLHFVDPERHWLWTRWMWDPRTRTGALPLVTSAAYDLRGGDIGEVYLKVGRAVAFVHEVGEAAGFQRISRSILGTDVFLSCVYAIYTYTVLRMRMTKEFNKVMPQLPELCRRLLGVHRPGAAPAAR